MAGAEERAQHGQTGCLGYGICPAEAGPVGCCCVVEFPAEAVPAWGCVEEALEWTAEQGACEDVCAPACLRLAQGDGVGLGCVSAGMMEVEKDRKVRAAKSLGANQRSASSNM